MNYLDFESRSKPCATTRAAKEIQDKNDLDMTTTVENRSKSRGHQRLQQADPWQRVQVTATPTPYTLDYIEALTEGNFLELLGTAP